MTNSFVITTREERHWLYGFLDRFPPDFRDGRTAVSATAAQRFPRPLHSGFRERCAAGSATAAWRSHDGLRGGSAGFARRIP
ncbi:hypothetical protein [Streptomyces sp. NPDC050121]|uniref:hypothetical protein n=1 Tax=Streptomyces sp. NPDC050121 TaxID=3365601 RepID=UPI003793108B